MDSSETLDQLIARIGQEEAIRYILSIANGCEQRADLPHIDVKVEYALAKYEGEYEDGKEPVEVLHFKD